MTSHVQRAIRARMKALRLDPHPVAEVKVDSPRDFAAELGALMVQEARRPGRYSEAHRVHVEAHFSAQYLRFCEVAPVRRVGS